MDIDDDDAFLYGDSSETVPDIKPKSEVKEEISVAPALVKTEQTSNNAAASTSSTSTAAPAPLVPSKVAASSGVSSAMAASLAAYGIDPSAAIIEPTFEDGGIEEEEKEDDEEDDDDDEDDEDDVNFVFSGQTGRALDLRKAQQAPTNVIGIGKWAHTSTGQAPAADPRASATPQRATAPAPAPTANQTTEYVPAARPGPASAIHADPYPQIPPSGDTGTAPNLLQPSSTSSSAVPGVPSLPHSSLAPVTAPSTHPKVDPTHPSGIIPSSGNSVYDIDLAQFEGSGQPWRRPGSDLSDWFNFGFDEVSFPKFLRFRAEMEAGRNAMMNAPPMAPITPEVIHMLNLSLPPQQQQNPMQHQNNFNLNPAMMQQMQQMMGMQGVDMGMMAQMMGNMGGGQGMGMQGQAGQQGQPGQGPGQGMIGQQGQMRQNQPQRPSATPGPGQNVPDQGEEVKQEDMDPTAEGYVEGTVPPPNMAMRGRGMTRGMPMRGTMMRGRGAAPLGPRAATMPVAVPKGPKAGRFRDKDRVESGVAGSLDYGGESRESDGGSRRGRSISRSRSLSDRSRSRTRSPRGRDRDRGREKSYSKSQSRSRSRTPPRSTIGGAESRDRTKSKSPEKKRSRRRDDSDSPPPPRSGKSSRRDRSESPYEKSRGRREKEKQRDRDRERSYRDKEREKEKERPKRKREDGSLSVGLGPSGWGDEEDLGEKRSSRRRRSYSSESEESYRGKSKRK